MAAMVQPHLSHHPPCCALLIRCILCFHVLLQMLVQPLDRIFHIIRTNASQVIQALGTQEVRGARSAVHGEARMRACKLVHWMAACSDARRPGPSWGYPVARPDCAAHAQRRLRQPAVPPLQDQLAADASGPRGSRKDDVGINTIEAGAGWLNCSVCTTEAGAGWMYRVGWGRGWAAPLQPPPPFGRLCIRRVRLPLKASNNLCIQSRQPRACNVCACHPSLPCSCPKDEPHPGAVHVSGRRGCEHREEDGRGAALLLGLLGGAGSAAGLLLLQPCRITLALRLAARAARPATLLMLSSSFAGRWTSLARGGCQSCWLFLSISSALPCNSSLQTVDQSTKEWLATMVAGPASAEVAAASPNAGLTKQASDLR